MANELDFGTGIALIKGLGGKPTDEQVTTAVDAWLDAHPEATTTVEDGSISYAKLNSSLKGTVDDVGDLKTAIDDLEDAVATKANVDGSYPDMTVGNAEQLVATIGVEDAVPYIFRTAGGSADIGDREVDKIVGGTLAWNQLAKVPASGNGYKTGWSHSTELSYSDDKVTSTSLVDGVDIRYDGIGTILANTKMLVFAELESSVDVNVAFRALSNTQSIASIALSSGVKTQFSKVFSLSNNFAELQFMATTAVNDTLTLGNFEVFDLTQMFGSTIADYIYSLEQATAGAGVAWFRKLFPAPYYAYNAGELMSVQTSAHKMVGFNLFDKSNYSKIDDAWFDSSTPISDGSGRVVVYIPCFPNTKYCASRNAVVASDRFFIGYTNEEPALGVVVNGVAYAPTAQTVGNRMTITTTTGVNAKYLVVWAYWASTTEALDTLCINLSWDGERDGEYEPYQVWEYPLDSDLVLRGIPKLGADNNLYYDGDTYESDGTVTRRYGVVDLGTLTWSAYEEFAVTRFYTNSLSTLIKRPSEQSAFPNIMLKGYVVITQSASFNVDKTAAVTTNGIFYIMDAAYSDAAAFKAAMSGVYLVYELATPTTEEADPYQNPQIVEDFGTEEYIDTRAVAIPVGHDTTYRANLRAKLEMAPNSPDGDGDYIVRQANGQNEYVLLTKELPAAPSSDGNYILKCTVASGAATYTWEAQT